jgi:hypothetical protein
MNNLSTTAYFQLLTAFLKAIGQGDAINSIHQEEGIVEWEVGNLLVRLIPHHLSEEEIFRGTLEPNAIIIEADLMLLDLENRQVNHDRFLILHQLNAVSHLTTGIVAFITEAGMLSIRKILSLEKLDQEGLANQMAKVIKAAEELYAGWNELGNTFDPRNAFLQKEEKVQAEPTLDQKV